MSDFKFFIVIICLFAIALVALTAEPAVHRSIPYCVDGVLMQRIDGNEIVVLTDGGHAMACGVAPAKQDQPTRPITALASN